MYNTEMLDTQPEISTLSVIFKEKLVSDELNVNGGSLPIFVFFSYFKAFLPLSKLLGKKYRQVGR